MIYCPQCGNPNFDDANYCDTCGEPLISAEEYAKMRNAAEMQQLLEAQRQQREAAAYNKAYRKAQKDAKKAAKAKGAGGVQGASGAAAAAGGAGAGAVAGAQPGAPAGAEAAVAVAGSPDFPVYKHGCLAQAWDDITESEGWAKRILLLGLVNMVPVLNFFVNGFAMQWARQLPLDKVEGMPKKIFSDGSFLQGFYAFLIALIVGVISGVVSWIVGFVPVLGALVGFAASLFLQMFRIMSVMRIAIARNLGPGFDVKAMWKAAFTNRFGKFFCATLLPGIIVAAATVFVCGSALVVFGLNSLSSLVDSIQYAQQMEQMAQLAQSDPTMLLMNPMLQMYSLGANPWDSVVAQVMGLVPLFFILYLIAMFLAALSTVLTMRATAHYVTRYNHDWAALAIPSQPTAPASSAALADPTQPAAPAGQAHPAQTAVPAAPAGSTNPAVPTGPAGAARAATPASPADPTTAAAPPNPADTTDSTTPGVPSQS